MSELTWDVAVIGAGAAGLMAALRAAELGRRVLLLEKNRRPGVKILMSGGTRCNITHATDNRGIVDAYGPPGRFLHSALAAFSVQDTLDFFEGECVLTKVEELGKIFPVSNRAADVLDALLRRLHRSGATLALGEPVLDLERRESEFLMVTPMRTIQYAPRHPDDGRSVLPRQRLLGDALSHRGEVWPHHRPRPGRALVPITVSVPWVTELRADLTISPTLGCASWKTRDRWLRAEARCCSRTSDSPGRSFLTSAVLSAATCDPESLTLEIDLLPSVKEGGPRRVPAPRVAGFGQEATGRYPERPVAAATMRCGCWRPQGWRLTAGRRRLRQAGSGGSWYGR